VKTEDRGEKTAIRRPFSVLRCANSADSAVNFLSSLWPLRQGRQVSVRDGTPGPAGRERPAGPDLSGVLPVAGFCFVIVHTGQSQYNCALSSFRMFVCLP
jgi:hypothetical protein